MLVSRLRDHVSRAADWRSITVVIERQIADFVCSVGDCAVTARCPETTRQRRHALQLIASPMVSASWRLLPRVAAAIHAGMARLARSAKSTLDNLLWKPSLWARLLSLATWRLPPG